MKKGSFGAPTISAAAHPPLISLTFSHVVVFICSAWCSVAAAVCAAFTNALSGVFRLTVVVVSPLTVRPADSKEDAA